MAKILSFPRLARVIRLFSSQNTHEIEAPLNIHDEHEFISRRCREIEQERQLGLRKERLFELRVQAGRESVI